MSDERSFFHFLDDCVDHFPRAGDAVKQRDEVDIIHQLLQSGQPFNSEKAGFGDPFHSSIPEETSSSSSKIQEPVAQPSLPSPPPVIKTKGCSVPTEKSLKHKCDTCSQVFDSKIALSIHTGRIHKHEGRDKNYKCTHCPKTFFNSSYLAQHMRIHTGHKPYPCPDCDKRFTQLSHLQQHKRTHTGEKPYKCQQPGCTKAFSQLSNLQSHTRSHLPDGNVHKCTSCYKCYYDEASLNAHLRTHMVNKRVRNYRCEECGKTYTQDTYLQNHIKNKHGGLGLDTLNGNAAFPAIVTRPACQPTSIQAATSMICKVEDMSQHQSCGGHSAVRSSLVPQAAATDKLNNQMMGHAAYHPSDTSFEIQRANTIPTSCFNPSSTGSRPSFQESISAFKPVRPGFEPVDPCREGLRPTTRGYDHALGLPDAMPMINHVEMKDNIESEQQEADRLWKLRNSVSGGAGYPTLPSHIHNYMSSQSSYSPYTAYISSNPFDSPYGGDKGGMFGGEAMRNDYLMGGGLRQAYQLE